ncbi:hypothetical protein Agabi119p4_3040 [Agaricus bisporus var. burnettii]|uniref:HMA domain-containing protein n=1 Tax=Agaricus bisporus var. burnettii TaxID=192524 RepID=A0A8H7F6P5_AGABI|nr:hypothetical protein Agabi119p4_3040 [Agaricus bisporus var. burnettii]
MVVASAYRAPAGVHYCIPLVDMSEHTYKFDVKMTCGGCSGAITRALNKAKDNKEVSSFDVSLEKQEVVVKSGLGYEDILEKIKKTGKEVRSGVTVE